MIFVGHSNRMVLLVSHPWKCPQQKFSFPVFAASCASNYEHFSHAHLSHHRASLLHFCSQFKTDSWPLADDPWQLLALWPLSTPPSLAEESFSNYILLLCILSPLCSFIRHHKFFFRLVISGKNTKFCSWKKFHFLPFQYYGLVVLSYNSTHKICSNGRKWSPSVWH